MKKEDTADLVRSRCDSTSRVAVVLILCLGGLYTLYRVFSDISYGGHDFRQGDWLINAHIEPVRRGPFGSGILWVSDITGLGPLPVLGAIQATLILILFGALLHIAWSLRWRAIYSLLFVAPASSALFWSAEGSAALRKELIVYAALFSLICALKRESGLGTLFASGLFMIACFGHEANILFTPLFAGLLLSGRIFAMGPVVPIPLLVAVSITTIGSAAYAAAFPSAASTATVCDPLLARGLDPSICEGAVAWLSNDLTQAVEFTRETMRSRLLALEFCLLYVLCFAGIAYLLAHLEHGGRLAWICILSITPFTPLYFIAVDWGRWINFHFTSCQIIILFSTLIGGTRLKGGGNPWCIAAFIAIALLVSPDHIQGIQGGVIAEGIRLIDSILS